MGSNISRCSAEAVSCPSTNSEWDFGSRIGKAILEVSKRSLLQATEHYASRAERKFFNTAGWIPLVSIVSGTLREGMGSLMCIAALVELVVRLIFMANGRLFGFLDKNDLQQQRELLWSSVNLFFHGVSNCQRGGIETSGILGNILCFIYDKGFEMRFRYACEKQNSA